MKRGIVVTMPRIELFPFRYRDPITGKWVRARYVAERHEIAARYAEWEIIGAPEIRDVDPDARYFSPWQQPKQALLRFRHRHTEHATDPARSKARNVPVSPARDG